MTKEKNTGKRNGTNSLSVKNHGQDAHATTGGSTIAHYLSPTMFLAYAWAYGFTVFSALVGLETTRIWASWLTWPAVVFGYGALFAVVIGFRPILLDLVADLDLREKLGILVLQAVLFVTPKLTMRHASLIDCLIVIQVPFVALLLRRENFLRLYTANFLLVALSAFVAWQKWHGGFEWAACLVVFLAGCFAADHFFFELDRYPSIAARPVRRPLLLGAEYAAAALVGGSLLYLVTPELAVAERSAAAPTIVEQPGGPTTISFHTLLQLVWETFILLILIVVALAILQWLKRKYRRGQTDEESTMGGGVMRMVRKIIRPTPKPPQMPRGFSPREQILRGYWAWCDELERFGLVRMPVMTPKEFAQGLARSNQAIASPATELTQLFEWAKYDRRDLARGDAEAFFNHSRQVIEVLLTSVHMQ